MRPSDFVPWIGGILLGALIPALGFAGWSGAIEILPLAFYVTLGHTILLGVPVALFCRARHWTGLLTAIGGGFLIGAVPGGLLAWPISSNATMNASVGGVPTIVNGAPTWAGWLQYLQLVGVLGACGATGAAVFWLTFKWSGAFDLPATEGSEPPRQPQRPAVWLASGAVLATAAVLSIPSITKDRSCHNMFRDGRRAISSNVNVDLDISTEDWPVLTRLLQEFGRTRGASFRDQSRGRPDIVQALDISLCTEDGLNVEVVDQRWASRDYAPPLAGVQIGVYDLRGDGAWRPLARELVATLQAVWPEKIRFRDGGGRLIPMPDALKMPNS